MASRSFEIYTIGHSNRTIDNFLSTLSFHRIECVVDVRRFPKSKFPHFTRENLELHLRSNGIEYVWMEGLGGYRKKILDKSPNTAIKSEGFRNYADYMLTEKFREEIEKLIEVASRKRTAIMCAEMLYWRCHRKLISDFLILRGFRVLHIINNEVREHKLSKEARITDFGLIYDKQEV